MERPKAPEPKRARGVSCVPEESPDTISILQMQPMLLPLEHCFQYLNVQDLLRAGQVCSFWRKITSEKCMWKTVRMKYLAVNDWEAFAATLKRVGTKNLDLSMLVINDRTEAGIKVFWDDCIKALSKVSTLKTLKLGCVKSSVVEQMAAACPHLESITATTIKKDSTVDLMNFMNFGRNLMELTIRAQGHMRVINWSSLGDLNNLKHLSITSVENMEDVLPVVGLLTQLESLELGEMTNVTDSSVVAGLANLTNLKRLRLEKGEKDCPTDKILETISQLTTLVQLELINFDVKGRFVQSLGLCSNIKTLLIVPTYRKRLADTNFLVINGITQLASTLNHFIWGLTLQMTRVTDIFIDQWQINHQGRIYIVSMPDSKRIAGDSIPVLCQSCLDAEGNIITDTKIVDIVQIAWLQWELTKRMPTTKVKLLKVPFCDTWKLTINSIQ